MNMFSRLKSQIQLSVALAVVILRTRHPRRTLMFWLSIVAMVSCFFGGFVILDALTDSPIIFLIYWGAVLIQVIFLMLLAIYDMLAVTRELKDEARQNQPTPLTEEDPDIDIDP